jgi:hypothetical protein
VPAKKPVQKKKEVEITFDDDDDDVLGGKTITSL